ncbi:MAG: exosortase system-associated protein, TIGR04073 family [Candidatus Omnitrophica bacterium]|nr:exosortase system-associated protein, TIGR04073 family [Candidatus Omnitrophota bacterium]
MLKKIGVWVLVLGLGMLFISPAYAAKTTKGSCGICTRAESEAYGTKAPAALARGVANTGFGFTEILAQPVKETRQGGNAAVGFGKGIGQFVARELRGVAELATFWIPGVHQREIASSCALGTIGLSDR